MSDKISETHWREIILSLIYYRAKQSVSYTNWINLTDEDRASKIIEETRKVYETRGHFLVITDQEYERMLQDISLTRQPRQAIENTQDKDTVNSLPDRKRPFGLDKDEKVVLE